MKKKCLYEKLNNQKGAAAVITLSVILMLTALGTIALVVSTMSVTMSGKTVKWSDEYYSMDSMAENYIHQIDEVIANAEKDARIYVQNRLDRIEPTTPDKLQIYMNSKSLSFTGSYDYDMNSMTSNLIDDDVQRFFNEYYKYDWVDGITELTLNDYHAYKLTGDLDTISPSYAAAIVTGSTISTENAFELDYNNYISQLFDRVYYHFLSIRLLDYTEGYDTITGGGVTMPTSQNVVLKGGSAAYGHREPDADYRCTSRYTSISYIDEFNMISAWDSTINPSLVGHSIGLYIRIQGGTAQDPKQVRVDVDVTLPDYQTVTKYVHTPLYGNPLLTNALTAQGSISFDAGTAADGTDVEIYGDVYASGNNGISIRDNADIKIRGNVYTPGDLKVVGSNGKLTVDTVLTNGTRLLSYDFKNKTYGNSYLYDNGINNSIWTNDHIAISQYAPGGSLDQIPLIFHDDVDQGNVYCNSLFIGDETVEFAEIKVRGNLWTKDDIQLDANKSKISIGTVNGAFEPRYNYIGLSMESDIDDAGGIDHEASSSVINNYPFNASNGPSSEIVMDSNMIVPGVAFYEFNNGVYASVESVTSRTSNPLSLLNAYLHDPGDPTEEYDNYINQDLVHMDLIRADIPTKREKLIDFVRDTTTDPFFGGVYTNISTNILPGKIDGYIAGVALIDVTGDGKTEMLTHTPYLPLGANALTNSWNNFYALSKLSQNDNIKKIFYSKTKKLGTEGRNGFDSTSLVSDTVPLRDFIDTTISNPGSYFNDYEIKVIADGGKLNVNAVSEGIVYCDGDLTITSEATATDTITSDAEFRGTIICTGNVTIKDDVKLVYDEFVILEKLKNYYDVRQFFENIGATYFSMNKIDEIDIASTSGQRNVVKRVKIRSWRELPVSP